LPKAKWGGIGAPAGGPGYPMYYSSQHRPGSNARRILGTAPTSIRTGQFYTQRASILEVSVKNEVDCAYIYFKEELRFIVIK
jgi:hypothetical protein